MINTFKRLIHSRKLWGAFTGSAFIALIVYLDTGHTSTAITTLGVLWGAAIAGQGITDFIKVKQESSEN